MDIDLEHWQTRLAIHFAELHRHRSSKASGQPIFALEHGLGEVDLRTLSSAIQTHIQHRKPHWDHRLPWVVYAAELGYRYAGDEYWQTFEAQTPGWVHYGDRNWVRRCFQDFSKGYGGAKPTGTWAKHFTIICWPITHAILPQDLQRQLAHLLYELRHSFSPQLLESPMQLGELISAHSWNASSRFRQLTEEPLFIGQIAVALLLQDAATTSSLIHPATLTRISADLDRERRARTWLREAREMAHRRVRFQNIRGRNVSHGDADSGGAIEVKSESALRLEPRLILRPSAASTWEILLELPDFSSVRFQRYREVLSSTRCFVAGSSGRPLARGRLLYGPQQVILKSWPSYNEPLLQFENASGELDSLLRSEFVLRPKPLRLFKVASDGLAYELNHAIVRHGQRYLALFDVANNVPTHLHFPKVEIECGGVTAFELQLHNTISLELGVALSTLGIRQAGTVLIWPAGLTPSEWDGEGVAEWLSTDRPCVGIKADYHVESYSLELNGDRVNVAPADLGVPIFVELPQLSPGTYTLHISTTGHGSDTAVANDNLEVRIREPRIYAPGQHVKGALLVIVDPIVPTLEQLWEGAVNFEVHGPVSRHVQCDLAFFKKGDRQLFHQEKLPPLRLPIDNSMWQRHFENHFKQEPRVQNAYDQAHSCVLTLKARELGTFTLTTERDFTPLRWAVQRTRDRFALRILDDSGMEQVPRLSTYRFEAPVAEQLLDISIFKRAEGGTASAGLYVARTSENVSAIVIPHEVHRLQDLRVIPQFPPHGRTAADITHLLSILELWAKARITGSQYSLSMRSDVLRAILRKVFSLIAGERWSDVETLFESSSRITRQSLERVWKKREEIDLAAKLISIAPDLSDATPNECTRQLTPIANHYLHLQPLGIAWKSLGRNRNWLSELALRLSSCSTNTIEWAGGTLDIGISYLLDEPSLARAARFLVLAVAQERKTSAFSSNLYEGWTWQ